MNTDDVSIPEVFALLLQMRRAKQTNEYWTGGWSAQPYLLYLEFDACIAGEQKYQQLEEINRRLEEQYGNKDEVTRQGSSHGYNPLIG